MSETYNNLEAIIGEGEVNLEQAFTAFSGVISEYACFGNLDNEISCWSEEAVEYFGLPDRYVKNTLSFWLNMIREDYREEFMNKLNDLIVGKIDTHSMTYRIKNADGRYVTCSGRIRLIKHKYTGRNVRVPDSNLTVKESTGYFIGTIVNHNKNDAIDPITGLFGRESLLRHMNVYKVEKKDFYLLITGIRNFLNVNLSHGYNFGNQVLGRIGEFVLDMKKSLDRGMRVYRTEGTKILFFLDANMYGEEDIADLFNSFRQNLKNGILIDETEVSLDVCGAVIKANSTEIDVNSVYTSAYYALGKIKDENNGDLWFFNDNVGFDKRYNLIKLNTIRNSVTESFKGFYLNYQPIVNAETGKLAGVEALIRWKSPEYGNVPPSEFISWLENDITFYELGNWILRTSMQDAKELVKHIPDFMLNVNLSLPQIQRDEFSNDLNSIMSETGFEAKNLKLELTERCKIVNIDILKRKMEYFKAQGIKTAIDDFGTGYSALSLLVQLPVDQIKIDKSFIENIENDEVKQKMLTAITSYANSIDKEVCIEGIEKPETESFIKDNFNVTYFQGYLYSKPISVTDLKNWVKLYKIASAD